MNKSCPECVIPFCNHPPLSSTGLIKFHDDNVALPSVPRVSERKHRPFMWEQTSSAVLRLFIFVPTEMDFLFFFSLFLFFFVFFQMHK